MFKRSANAAKMDVVFDIETVPDMDAACRIYPELDEIRADIADVPDRDFALLGELYRLSGKTKDNPEPFLKYLLHRVVSIVALVRKTHVKPATDDNPHGVELKWMSLPGADLNKSEADIIGPFLNRLGESQPTLVGWSSAAFDITVLTQRALINRLVIPSFFRRPDKPWEGADYFSEFSDAHFDLAQVLSSKSPQSKASLNAWCRANRIPGKLATDGSDVARMYFDGRLADIVAYNETDVCSTYLAYLELLRSGGQITEAGYECEQRMFCEIMADKAGREGGEHFRIFVKEWNRLNAVA